MTERSEPDVAMLAGLFRDLVGEDREVAYAAVIHWWSQVPEEIRAQTPVAIQQAGMNPGEYAEALAETIQYCNNEFRDAATRENERFERALAAPGNDGVDVSEEEDRDALKRRIREYDEQGQHPDEQMQEELVSIGAVASQVLVLMGPLLAESQSAIRRLLADRATAHSAYSAIEQLGPAGFAFGDELIEELASNRGDSSLHSASVAVIRHHPPLIEKLIARFWAIPSPYPYPCSIDSVIADLGKECAAIDPGFPAKLLEGTYSDDVHRVVGCVVALGGVTAGTDYAVSRLIELSRHPAEIVQGVAIYALGENKASAERVVPHLASLFGVFEEYNCDEMYYGAQSRVAGAMAAFGPDAAMALKEVLGHLQPPPKFRNHDNEVDVSILRLLAAMGPAASEALPLLNGWLERLREFDCPDMEEIEETIAAIRGQSESKPLE